MPSVSPSRSDACLRSPTTFRTVSPRSCWIRSARRRMALDSHGGSSTAARALVLGAGPIGLGAIIVLARMGFGAIDVVDPAAYRASFAEMLRARATSPEVAAVGR